MTRLFCCLIALAFSAPAIACRDVALSHEQRVDEADVAVLAVVSGVFIPELERAEVATNINVSVVGVLADRNVRFAVIDTLKGHADPVITATVTQCDGSLAAQAGTKVYAYRSDGTWRLEVAPKAVAGD